MEDRAQDNYTNRSEVSQESLKHPQQESGDKKLSTTDEESLRRVLLENPKVLEELRQKLIEPEKTDDPSKLKKSLQAVVGFVQLAASGSTSRAKVVFLYIWAKLMALFAVQLEIWKGKREEIDELQNNLRAVNETHEKVQEKMGEIEDKIKEARANSYKISSTESKDLEIELIMATRDLGNSEDVLSDAQEDIERLKAVIGWRLFAQIIGFVFVLLLAAAASYYSADIRESFHGQWFADQQQKQQHPDSQQSSHAEAKGLSASDFVMMAGCVVLVMAAPLKRMIESLYINSKLLSEYEKFLKDDVRKAKWLQKKLKRAVEKEIPEMKKHLAVLECDISRYASLQKLNSD